MILIIKYFGNKLKTLKIIQLFEDNTVGIEMQEIFIGITGLMFLISGVGCWIFYSKRRQPSKERSDMIIYGIFMVIFGIFLILINIFNLGKYLI